MMRVALRVGSLLLAYTLVLGFLETGVIAVRNLFQEYDRCPARVRLNAFTGFTVYRTEQRNQILVTWDHPNPASWNLMGFTAQITVLVDGPGGLRAHHTYLGASGVVFEDIDTDSAWIAQLAVIDRGYVISDIVSQEFIPTALDLVPSEVAERVAQQASRLGPGAAQVKPGDRPLAATNLSPVGEDLAVYSGSYDELTGHAQGQYRLWREGTQVTAIFRSTAADVRHAVRPQPHILFTVPLGFRPAEAQVREVAGWPLHADGTPNRESGEPHRIQLEVAADGAVRYVDGPELDRVGDLSYVLATTWFTPETSGTMADPGGHYALRRSGSIVSGFLSLPRSLESRDTPAPPDRLFMVPPGFRPVHTVSFEVPANQSGPETADSATGLVPRLQVESSGVVRYAEEEGVDPEGHRAATVVVRWATTEAPLPRPVNRPDLATVCERHAVVQATLTSALEAHDDVRRRCADITWMDLATLTSLSLAIGWGHPPLVAGDLAGLLGLDQLTLSWPLPRPLSGDLLSGIPHLTALHLDLHYVDMPDLLPERLGWLPPGSAPTADEGWTNQPAPFPADLLAYTPQLRQLTLRVTGAHPDSRGSVALPPGFLAHNPELRDLSIQLPMPRYYGASLVLPQGLLAHNPRLQTLSLQAQGIDRWPPDFLAHNPELRDLSIATVYIPSLPRRFLASNPDLEKVSFKVVYGYEVGSSSFLETAFRHNPRLREIEIEAYGLKSLPPRAFWHNPRLQRLRLSGDVENIPARLLLGNPHLQAVEFHFPVVERLPPDLFTHSPQLRQVVLATGVSGETLASELFAYNPQLRTLTIQGSRLWTLPDGILAHNTHLRDLTLQSGGLRYLPSGFLAHQNHLQRLQIQAEQLALVPARLLASSPQLQHLSLQMGSNTVIQGNPLAYTPQLRSLHWTGGKSLPPDFLIHTPSLTSLELGTYALTIPDQSLSAELLVHTPQLQRFLIYAQNLTELPANLLVSNLQLQEVLIDSYELQEIPTGLLGDNPQLQSLTLWMNKLERLPQGLLDYNPQLQSLALRMDKLEELPADLLAHNTRLRSLQLGVDSLESFPSGFLVHNPELQTLEVRMEYPAYTPKLSMLPPGFLAHNPKLHHLTLAIDSLEELPTDFLAANRQLQELAFRHTPLRQLPSGFLAYHPQLQAITIEHARLSGVPQGFLTQSPHLRHARIYELECRPYVPGACERDLLAEWLRAESAETE